MRIQKVYSSDYFVVYLKLVLYASISLSNINPIVIFVSQKISVFDKTDFVHK